MGNLWETCKRDPCKSPSQILICNRCLRQLMTTIPFHQAASNWSPPSARTSRKCSFDQEQTSPLSPSRVRTQSEWWTSTPTSDSRRAIFQTPPESPDPNTYWNKYEKHYQDIRSSPPGTPWEVHSPERSLTTPEWFEQLVSIPDTKYCPPPSAAPLTRKRARRIIDESIHSSANSPTTSTTETL